MWENIGEIFNHVLRASLYSVAVVFIIVITQKLTRRILSARWIYVMWLVLLAQLLLPAGIGLETGWSFWNLTPERLAQWTVAETGGLDATGITTPNGSIARSTAARSIGTIETTSAVDNNSKIPERHIENRFPLNREDFDGFSSPGIMRTLTAVWLAGVLVMIAVAAFINLRLWKSVRGLATVTDSKLLELFEDCKRQLRMKTTTGLVVTNRVENPFLFGFIRPRVLLPADLVRHTSLEQLRCILLHELAHHKRGDIITGWILAVLQSLHWFNPVIWWAFYRMRFDRESACDSLVLSRLSGETRSHYGDALIGMLERFNHPQRLPAIVAGIIENKSQLKRRLIMISKFKSPSRNETVAAAALLAVLAIALLSSPKTLPAQPDEQVESAHVVRSGFGIYRILQNGDVFILTDDGRSDIHLSPQMRERLAVSRLPYRFDGDDMQSRLIHKVEPVYPEAAKSAGISGIAQLDITIDGEGAVVEAVVKGVPAILGNSAVDAVLQWRYNPILINGTPISAIFAVLVDFRADGTVDTTYRPGLSISNVIAYRPILVSNDPLDVSGLSDDEFNARGYRYTFSSAISYNDRFYYYAGSPEISDPVIFMDKKRLREVANANWLTDDSVEAGLPANFIVYITSVQL